MLYKRDDVLLYGSHGICKVISIESRNVNRKNIDYYVLEPLEQSGTRYYIPIKNDTAVHKLKRVLSAGELEQLLNSQNSRQEIWIEDEAERKQAYRRLIQGEDRAALLAMIRLLQHHKKYLHDLGRKLHQCDETFLRDAEKIIGEEISFVLGIPKENIAEHIAKK